MTRTSALLQQADALVRRVRFDMGREIRDARLSAGIGLRTAGARAGMSHTQFRRLELGNIERLTVEHLARGCAAVGLQPLIRTVPGAGLALDSGQLALIGRLRRELPSSVTIATEVPLPIPGDRRAWDLVLGLAPSPLPVDAEARLRDIQALQRRSALKLRDSEFDRLLLLISDTANNRRMLAAYREELRPAFPIDTRQVMVALRAGMTPEASGIAVL